MAQQTAVEWLLNEIADNSKTHNQWKRVIEQAKAMEKEQIINAHGEDRSYLQDDGSWKRINGEQYYNETYGSQGSNDTTSPNN